MGNLPGFPLSQTELPDLRSLFPCGDKIKALGAGPHRGIVGLGIISYSHGFIGFKVKEVNVGVGFSLFKEISG